MNQLSDLRITTLLVTFNSAHCIESLASRLPKHLPVIVVDNASEDDTVSNVQQFLPHATLIINNNNVGFGGANNIGIAQANTSHVLLLNPDCLPDPTLYEQLAAAIDSFPEAAIIAPQIIRRDGSLEVSYRFPKTHWKSLGQGAEGPCCVGFASGAALLLNKKTMFEVGYFDENFFLYYEDEDLCQRVFDAQKELIIYPSAQVIHLSRGSVKGKSPLKSEYLRGYHHAQSKLLFEFKYVGSASRTKLRYKTLVLAVLNLLVRLLFPQPKYVARLIGRIKGLIDA